MATKPKQVGIFEGPIQRLFDAQQDLKNYREDIKKLERDYPIRTKEKMSMLKKMRAEVKAEQEQHVLELARNNGEYREQRDMVQKITEDLKDIKHEIKIGVAKEMQEKGEYDETIIVQGHPFRLQGSTTYGAFLNGKAL